MNLAAGVSFWPGIPPLHNSNIAHSRSLLPSPHSLGRVYTISRFFEQTRPFVLVHLSWIKKTYLPSANAMTSTDTEGKSPGASASITAATTNASDASNQENNSPRGSSSKLSSKQQIRHRASVACASCRDRRIRCVVPKGQGECTQCKRTGIECIIKNDDERRRYVYYPALNTQRLVSF